MTTDINKIIEPYNGNFFLIAGPCVVEGEEITLSITRNGKEIEIDVTPVMKESSALPDH